MPTPFPHHYDAMLTWPGSGPAALGSEGRPTIAGGPPPEFDGEQAWWSPEHLLLSSAGGLGFTYLALDIEIAGRPQDERRVRDLMSTAKHHCIVARALNAPVHMTVNFRPVAAETAAH
jgi:organic hydroperoxide reductase OsmC/OhrA